MNKEDLIGKLEKKREKLEESLEEIDLILESLNTQTKLTDFENGEKKEN